MLTDIFSFHKYCLLTPFWLHISEVNARKLHITQLNREFHMYNTFLWCWKYFMQHNSSYSDLALTDLEIYTDTVFMFLYLWMTFWQAEWMHSSCNVNTWNMSLIDVTSIFCHLHQMCKSCFWQTTNRVGRKEDSTFRREKNTFSYHCYYVNTNSTRVSRTKKTRGEWSCCQQQQRSTAVLNGNLTQHIIQQHYYL